MRMSEELYRIGREAALSPEDRNHILTCAGEIDRLRYELGEAEKLYRAAWEREKEWKKIWRNITGMEEENGTDR